MMGTLMVGGTWSEVATVAPVSKGWPGGLKDVTL